MTRLRLSPAVIGFLATCFGLSVALSVLVGFTGGHESRFAAPGVFLAMLFPTIGVIAARVGAGARVEAAGWRRFPLAYLPLALFLIPLVMHLAMVPLVAGLEGGVPWQDWLTPQSDGLYHSPEARGWGTITSEQLVRRIALNAVVGVLVVSILAFFEEIGWRAWLLPRLVADLGVHRAVVAGALIWAFWHTPLLLSGVQYVEGISAPLTALIAFVGHVGAGLVIGWFWLRTESIWIVCLAHGALNNWGQYAFKYMGSLGGHDALLLFSGNLALLVLGSVLATKCLDDRPEIDTA